MATRIKTTVTATYPCAYRCYYCKAMNIGLMRQEASAESGQGFTKSRKEELAFERRAIAETRLEDIFPKTQAQVNEKCNYRNVKAEAKCSKCGKTQPFVIETGKTGLIIGAVVAAVVVIAALAFSPYLRKEIGALIGLTFISFAISFGISDFLIKTVRVNRARNTMLSADPECRPLMYRLSDPIDEYSTDPRLQALRQLQIDAANRKAQNS